MTQRRAEVAGIEPEIVWMSPHSIGEIFGNISRTRRGDRALCPGGTGYRIRRARLQRVADITQNAPRRPRVFCLNGIEPYYCCGMGAELIGNLGGHDALGRKGADSVRIPWGGHRGVVPEILIVSAVRI